jgi:hypothetical protein
LPCLSSNSAQARGGYFTSDFGGGAEASATGFDGSIKTPYYGGGGFAFFDATYAEVSLGFFSGGGTMDYDMRGFFEGEADMSVMGLDIGLLGKYPFAISEQLTVFPLLGIAYRIMLSAEDEDGDQIKNFATGGKDDVAGDLSALWFKLGGGLDYSFTDQIYLRGGLLYGLRLANAFEYDAVDAYKAMDPKTRLGHGLEIKVAVGYRF